MRVIIELRTGDGVTRIERDVKHDQYELEPADEHDIRAGVLMAANEALARAGYPQAVLS